MRSIIFFATELRSFSLNEISMIGIFFLNKLRNMRVIMISTWITFVFARGQHSSAAGAATGVTPTSLNTVLDGGGRG